MQGRDGRTLKISYLWVSMVLCTFWFYTSKFHKLHIFSEFQTRYFKQGRISTKVLLCLDLQLTQFSSFCRFFFNILHSKRNWIFMHGLVQGLLSMNSLLTHNVAHSTRPSFKPKTNNQTSPFFSLKNVILEAHFLLLTFLETFNFQITLFCKI